TSAQVFAASSRTAARPSAVCRSRRPNAPSSFVPSVTTKSMRSATPASFAPSAAPCSRATNAAPSGQPSALRYQIDGGWLSSAAAVDDHNPLPKMKQESARLRRPDTWPPASYRSSVAFGNSRGGLLVRERSGGHGRQGRAARPVIVGEHALEVERDEASG